MYRIFIDNMRDFTQFLNVNSVDFVDIFLQEGTALIVSDTSEVFAAFTLSCECGIMDTQTCFRVPKGAVFALAVEGSVSFDVSAQEVRAVFRNAARDVVWSVTFGRQKVFSRMYKHKIELLRKLSGKMDVSFDDLGVLPKICSKTGGMLCADSHACGVLVSPGIRVYKKVQSAHAFCLPPNNLMLLKKCSSMMFDAEDYVCASGRHFAVMVKKSRQSGNDDYEYVAGEQSPFKSQYEAEINLGGVMRFFSVKNIKEAAAVVSLEERLCSMCIDGMRYEIPVAVKNERKAKALDFPELAISNYVMQNVLLQMGKTVFQIHKKKNFIQLLQDDYVILFN